MDVADKVDIGNGLELRIYRDEEPQNPREFDNLSIFALFHRRYSLGDKDLTIKDRNGEYHTIDSKNYESWDAMESDLQKRFDIIVIIPVYMYDHSGITIRHFPFDCRWDSGQIGFAIVTRESFKKFFGDKKIVTKKRFENIKSQVIGEIETFDAFIKGDVYGFKLINMNPLNFKSLGSLDNEEEEIDSCWGYYGDNYNTNGIWDAISGYLIRGNKGDMDVSNRI